VVLAVMHPWRAPSEFSLALVASSRFLTKEKVLGVLGQLGLSCFRAPTHFASALPAYCHSLMICDDSLLGEGHQAQAGGSGGCARECMFPPGPDNM